MQKLWLEGSLFIEGKQPLEVLRRQFLDSADRLGYTARDVAADPSPHRAVLTANWTDPYRDTPVKSLLVAEVAPEAGGVRWLLAGVSAKIWSFWMRTPLGLLGLLDAGRCDDPSGMALASGPLPLFPRSATQRRDLATLLAAGITHTGRRTSLLVAACDPDGINDRMAWPGIIDTVIIDEAGRRALNDVVPLRQIPAGGARLYSPLCDGQPDVVMTSDDWHDQTALAAGVTKAFVARRATPLPDNWATDPALAPWWADPDTEPVEPGVPAASDPDLLAQVQQLGRQLHEARQALRISQRLTSSAQEEREALAVDNESLRARLADVGDDGALEQLRAQLADTATERDLYVEALEEVTDERDDLLRTRARLTAVLAAHLGDTTTLGPDSDPEPATFPDLLAAASTAFPHLVITADPAPAALLDAHPQAAGWRRKTWNALATLDHLAAARADHRAGNRPLPPDLANARAFAAAGGPGALISASTIALRETEAVTGNDRFHHARCFPLHPERDERAFFGPHIRIGARATAPRLHFLDAPHGLIIGYIGPHLPNPATART